jgi:hypothetical protein
LLYNSVHHQTRGVDGKWDDILGAPRLRERILELDPTFGDHWTGLLGQLCQDGFNPYDHGNTALTPEVIQILNLPDAMRKDPKYMIFAGVSASPKNRTPKKLQTHLQLPVDELIDLFEPIQHPTLALLFRLLIAQTTMDYQGHCKFLNRVEAAASHASFKCDQVGTTALGTNKITFPNFRQWLPTLSSTRTDHEYGPACHAPPPAPIDLVSRTSDVDDLMGAIQNSHTWGGTPPG